MIAGILQASTFTDEELAQFSADIERLRELAANPDLHPYLASNAHSPVEVINTVWEQSRDAPGVARAVGYHPNTSEYVLRRAYLSNEAPPEYRPLFVAHPETPAIVLDYAKLDPSWQVRSAVASHRNITPEIAEHLMADSVETVAQAAAANPERFAQPPRNDRQFRKQQRRRG
ncbi:hypothetical protein ACFVAJ_18825 [Agromyces sp. NPDC057679]|uniref:hypothetical protein n=1 Tax=Agromyces sp. NPDC057679 TaxID=3346207 RepID=UPI00366CE0AD